jgi:hypothetical protein
MNNTVTALGMFVAGTALGFTVGYYMNRKNHEKEMREAMEAFDRYSQPSEPENSQGEEIMNTPDFKPAKFAKPDGTKGINYTQYNKDQDAKAEAESPTEEDIPQEEEDMSEYEETYEERLERENQEREEAKEEYSMSKEGKIELMRSDEWDTDFPETDYDREDLYFFTEDDTLTDEDGKVLPEDEYIGPKVRQIGWMRSPDDVIYIRNHPKEKEYRVFKETYSVSDWF